MAGSLNIYYDLHNNPTHKINCWCSEWKRTNQEVTIETFVDHTDKDILFDNLRPGAVKELYSVLGDKHFVDSTWQNINTLEIEPVSGYQLYNMYRSVKLGIKSISYEPINPYYWRIEIIGIVLWEDV